MIQFGLRLHDAEKLPLEEQLKKKERAVLAGLSAASRNDCGSFRADSRICQISETCI